MKKLFISLIFMAAIATATAVDISGTLPVIYINTDTGNPVTSRDEYVTATYYVDPMGTEGISPIGSAAAPLPLQIKGRGNWTWVGFDKKPYRLKLNAKAALLGMNKSKHFVLLAAADDIRGFLRNPVGYELSRLIGMKWTPADQPCELVINGSYEGLYFLTENIRVAKDRVNIFEQADNQTHPDSISGGWIVEIDNYDTDPHIEITEGDGARIIFTYKSPEILSSQQQEFLTSQMSTINSLIYDSNKENCKWAEYIDLNELAKFYIVNELTDNYESFHGSCYLHRDLGADQKWYFGPVWDFGSAFNYNKTQPLYQGREHHNTWIREMCKFPQFIDVVKTEWQNFYTTNYNDIYTFIDNYAATITDAAAADLARWPAYGNNNMAQKTGTVKARLRSAVKYLCEQWGPEPEPAYKLKVYFQDNDPNPWAEVYVFSWDPEEGSKALLGVWPGTKMTPITYQDKQTWSFTIGLDAEPSTSTGIIFGNGGAGKPDNQTEDLIFENNKIYDRNGVIGDIAAIDETFATDDTPTLYYDLTGRPVTNPSAGIYIRKRGAKVDKIYIK